MCSMSVLCPLCAQTSFGSIDALRVSLIKAANEQLPCPICHELFWGLDKLTIHLFSHTSLMTATTAATAEVKSLAEQQQTAIGTTAAATSIPTKITAGIVNNKLTKAPSKEKKTKKLKQYTAETVNEQPSQQQLNSPQQQLVLNNMSNNNINTCTAISTCDICELTFRNADLRDMHIRLVHQNLNLNLNSPGGEQHRNLATNHCATNTIMTCEPEFKCHLCAKTFKMKGSLRVHLKVVHLMGLPCVSNSPKLSICDRIRHKEAKATTTNNTKLNSTQSSTLVVGGNSTQQLLSMTAQLGNVAALPITATCSDVSVSGELVQCMSAANDDASSAGLNSNVLLVFNGSNYTATATALPPSAHELDNNEMLGKSSAITNTATTNTLNADNSKIWDCDVCAKSFTTKYFLKKHKRLHTGEMPYTCEICARTFTFQQSYHKHLLYHSDEKPHVCATCGRCFKELSTLHNHERIHSGEKPFACEVCGKCFRQRVSFLVHTRIHTGVMPYKCEVCQKCFRYKVSQRTHKCLPKLPSEVDDDGTGGNVDVAEADEENVDQISENFIKAFLESTSVGGAGESHNSPASAEIAALTADSGDDMDSKTVLDEALLSKAIDDIVVESCHKMGIGRSSAERTTTATGTIHAAMETHFGTSPCHLNGFGGAHHEFSDGSNSPSQKLQNMRLYSSPQLVSPSEMDGVVGGAEGGFPRFLFDDVGSNLL